jgi:hypothetical protein
VGNRITQATLAGTNNYVYDIVNRLIEVDGVSYTWDANGNLLSCFLLIAIPVFHFSLKYMIIDLMLKA